MQNHNDYGKCEICNAGLIPEWFKQQETIIRNNTLIYTGRTRLAVNFLTCPNCHKNYTVDDSFDKEWH